MEDSQGSQSMRLGALWSHAFLSFACLFFLILVAPLLRLSHPELDLSWAALATISYLWVFFPASPSEGQHKPYSSKEVLFQEPWIFQGSTQNFLLCRSLPEACHWQSDNSCFHHGLWSQSLQACCLKHLNLIKNNPESITQDQQTPLAKVHWCFQSFSFSEAWINEFAYHNAQNFVWAP